MYNIKISIQVTFLHKKVSIEKCYACLSPKQCDKNLHKVLQACMKNCFMKFYSCLPTINFQSRLLFVSAYEFNYPTIIRFSGYEVIKIFTSFGPLMPANFNFWTKTQNLLA